MEFAERGDIMADELNAVIQSLGADPPYLMRLVFAAVCGAAIGLERTLRQKEADIRTHIIVCLSSALMMMIISKYGTYLLEQIYIPIFLFIFCYILSNKNKKYILYSLLSLLINTIVQYVCYFIFKGKYTNWNIIGGFDYILASLDYFIVMFLIILSKEIYLKYKKKEV